MEISSFSECFVHTQTDHWVTKAGFINQFSEVNISYPVLHTTFSKHEFQTLEFILIWLNCVKSNELIYSSVECSYYICGSFYCFVFRNFALNNSVYHIIQASLKISESIVGCYQTLTSHHFSTQPFGTRKNHFSNVFYNRYRTVFTIKVCD